MILVGDLHTNPLPCLLILQQCPKSFRPNLIVVFPKLDYIMIFFPSGDPSLTVLCGRIETDLKWSSSAKTTSSASTESPSIRTHFPMMQSKLIIESLIQEEDFTVTLANKVEFLMRTPPSILQLGPMTTFGPITQPSPILALESYCSETSSLKQFRKKEK